jgi:acid phosphatase (class A)
VDHCFAQPSCHLSFAPDIRRGIPFLLLNFMQRRTRLFVLVCASLIALPALVPATQLHYLAADSLDAVALLPPPPAAGSAEAAADLATTRTASRTRTPAQATEAAAEVKLTVFRFAAAIGSWFESGKFPKTEEFFHALQSDTSAVTDAGKSQFQRLRPYAVDPTIVPLATESSFSYPSGHASRATVFALVLAELFPDKREALLRIGRDIGWNRVVAGVHFPSDILAGRVLGQAIVREMRRNPLFIRDLAEAKAELAAVPLEPAAARP